MTTCEINLRTSSSALNNFLRITVALAIPRGDYLASCTSLHSLSQGSWALTATCISLKILDNDQWSLDLAWSRGTNKSTSSSLLFQRSAGNAG